MLITEKNVKTAIRAETNCKKYVHINNKKTCRIIWKLYWYTIIYQAFHNVNPPLTGCCFIFLIFHFKTIVRTCAESNSAVSLNLKTYHLKGHTRKSETLPGKVLIHFINPQKPLLGLLNNFVHFIYTYMNASPKQLANITFFTLTRDQVLNIS